MIFWISHWLVYGLFGFLFLDLATPMLLCVYPCECDQTACPLSLSRAQLQKSPIYNHCHLSLRADCASQLFQGRQQSPCRPSHWGPHQHQHIVPRDSAQNLSEISIELILFLVGCCIHRGIHHYHCCSAPWRV